MKSIYRQFRRPTGVLGAIVGRVMARRNRVRGEWVVSLLDLAPGERVLEVGFGPGVDAERALARVGPAGSLLGVDASTVMVHQAAHRNAAAVKGGRAAFLEGDIDAQLPVGDGEYDAAFAINNAQFWSSLDHGFEEMARALKPGGRLVVAIQPRNPGASAADSERWAERLAEAARAAGLRDVSAELGPTAPPVAAVRARRAA
ncbi:MAG: methyltransferase domain-containing protein [Myxococcales bacterium]|jgi:ubiquinone/menaquinone biosynthesis C-methylase UbiE|nr:methyltransferase domain-containing protein [Myxococcales bacterium]